MLGMDSVGRRAAFHAVTFDQSTSLLTHKEWILWWNMVSLSGNARWMIGFPKVLMSTFPQPTQMVLQTSTALEAKSMDITSSAATLFSITLFTTAFLEDVEFLMGGHSSSSNYLSVSCPSHYYSPRVQAVNQTGFCLTAWPHLWSRDHWIVPRNNNCWWSYPRGPKRVVLNSRTTSAKISSTICIIQQHWHD